MALRIPTLVSLALFVAASSPLAAQEATPAAAPAAAAPLGDAKRGQELAYTCNGCHSIPNYKNVYPTYTVPKLRGQRPEYLVSALKAYKAGERSHGTMHSQAASLSEQDMLDIATYLAGRDIISQSVNEPAPGQKPPKAAETCRACHGLNGVGITADFPTLAGQHHDYLARALHDYKKGGRKNPIMTLQVTSLTAADIEELARYFSKQKPALETVQKHNYAAN
jgi:cytochrome c553